MNHADLLALLLPPGAYDPNGSMLAPELAAEGAALDAALDSAEQVLAEVDPRTAHYTLADWERVYGLPDPCVADQAFTLQERRAAVVSKMIAVGGATPAYFEALAAAMGYQVVVEEFRPFICGKSRCGDALNGGAVVRYIWRVKVLSARITYFRAGASRCGDSLGKISRADDLECRLARIKPAHTHLIVAYEGA